MVMCWAFSMLGSLLASPFSFSLDMILVIGASIQMFPDVILRLFPFLSFITLLCVSLEAVLFTSVPRNSALPLRELVMRVLSGDKVSFRVLRKTSISLFSCSALLLVPQTPMIQSSAYRTYSILVNSVLYTRDFIALLYFFAFFISEVRALSSGLG